MKRYGLILVLALGFGGLTGCSVTKEWIVTTAKDIAVRTVDSQINKLNEKVIGPEIARLEEQLGTKVDADDDGLWSDDEIVTAIKSQSQTAIKDAISVFKEDSDKSLTERLKNLATKEDGMKGLLLLVVAWVLAKLGIKVGPKGLQSLKERLAKPKA